MRLRLIFICLLQAATAIAETRIIEYPDHVVAEVTGTSETKSADGSGNTAIAPDDETAEQRLYLVNEIKRLQQERQELTKRQEWDPPDEVRRKQLEAQEKQKEIKRISSELAQFGNKDSGRSR